MTRPLRLLAAAAAIALALGRTPAQAQVPGEVAPAERGAPPAGVQEVSDTLHPEAPFPELRRRLEDVRRRRLVESLRLDERQAADLELRFGEFRRRQGELRRERHRLLEELRRGVEAREGARGSLAARLEALRRNQQERERTLASLREELRRALTLEQQARLQLFAERFQRQLSEGVRGIHDRRAGIAPSEAGAAREPGPEAAPGSRARRAAVPGTPAVPPPAPPR